MCITTSVNIQKSAIKCILNVIAQLKLCNFKLLLKFVSNIQQNFYLTWFQLQVKHRNILTNSMAYETRRFNVEFARTLKYFTC